MERWFALKRSYKVNAYDNGKLIPLKQNLSIDYLLYQESIDYARKKSLGDSDFMQNVSEHRDQSKGQLNELLSSTIQPKNDEQVCPDFDGIVAGMQNIRKSIFSKQEELKMEFLTQREELKIMHNEFGQVKKELLKESKNEFDELKNELFQIKQVVGELSKVVKDLATNRS